MPAKQNQEISIVEIERAINHWRAQFPSSRDTMTLCPQAASLAELYARMILFQMNQISWSEFSAPARKAFQEAQAKHESNQHKAA